MSWISPPFSIRWCASQAAIRAASWLRPGRVPSASTRDTSHAQLGAHSDASSRADQRRRRSLERPSCSSVASRSHLPEWFACHHNARSRSRDVIRRRSSTRRGTSSGSARRRSGCTSRAVAHARHSGWSRPSCRRRATRPLSAHQGTAASGSMPELMMSISSSTVTSAPAAWTHSSMRLIGSSAGSAARQPPSARPAAISPGAAAGFTSFAASPSFSARSAAALASLPRSPPSGGPATRPRGLYQPSPNTSWLVCTPICSPAGRNSTDTASFSGAGRMTRPRRCTKTRSEVVGARCITTEARVSSQPSVSRSALHSTSMRPAPKSKSTRWSSRPGVWPDTAAARTPRWVISSASACAWATVAVYATPASSSGWKCSTHTSAQARCHRARSRARPRLAWSKSPRTFATSERSTARSTRRERSGHRIPRSIADARSSVAATGPNTCSTCPVVVAPVAVKPTATALTARSSSLRVWAPRVAWASSQIRSVTDSQSIVSWWRSAAWYVQIATPGLPAASGPSGWVGIEGKCRASAAKVCSARLRRGTSTSVLPPSASARARNMIVLPEPVGASTHVRVAPCDRRPASSSSASSWWSRRTTSGQAEAGSVSARERSSPGEAAGRGSVVGCSPSDNCRPPEARTWSARHARVWAASLGRVDTVGVRVHGTPGARLARPAATLSPLPADNTARLRPRSPVASPPA